jgi:hypothetical protein
VAANRGDEPGNRARRWESVSEDAAARSRRVILYTVRRYLGFTAGEWDALSWDIRRAYLAGLDEDETVPFSFRAADTQVPGGGMGPQVRQGVNAGVSQIDLGAMVADLEAARQRRDGSGGTGRGGA